MSSKFPVIGEPFEGRYDLRAIIGEGGYARVYKAHQTDLGRSVAIKVLRSHEGSEEQQVKAAKRFEREAKLMSQLRDPHTVTVFDYGQTDSGALYMVTEYVAGKTLHEVIFEEGALDPDRVVNLVLQILYSLQEAHDLGVLHRDIKPANVMLFELSGRTDQVKMLDFGIAKLFDDEGQDEHGGFGNLTGKGRVVGSPGYMSPEQILMEDLAPASDLYSVGLIAYEMLTGNRAIKSIDDLRAAHEQIQGSPIVLPDDLMLVSGLRTVVNKLMLKDQAERYQSAAEVIDDLKPLLKVPTAAFEAAAIAKGFSPAEASEISEAASAREVVVVQKGIDPKLVLAGVVLILLVAIAVALLGN